MRAQRSTAVFVLLFAILFSASYLFEVKTASAVGSAADAMCNPVIPTCPCGQVPNPKGGCMGGSNMFMCPCSDMTSGFTTAGQCVAANTCLAQSTGGGGITQMSQLMQMLGQLMQSLGGGGGGGGGSGSGSSAGCTTYTQTSNPNNADPCSYFVPGASDSTSNLLNGGTGTTGGSTAVSDLLSSLVGSGNSNSNSNSNTGSTNNNSSSTSSTSSSNSGGSTVASSVIASITNPQDLKPGTSAKVSQAAFGNAPGITGDIQVLSGNRVTMLASNRDTVGNKQTSGFSGFSTTIGEDVPTVYAQACSARQWANNFLSTIIPASYFDNLCTSHNYSIAPPVLQPATPPPSPSTAPSSAPKATSTPPYIGPMKADIWVSPTTVTAGSRASLFWSASGVLSCQISSPSGVLGSALSGTAAVGPLSNDATYSIACQSATSSVSKQVTIKVQ